METIFIKGTEVHAVSPEGKTGTMPLADLMSRLAPRRVDTGDLLLPDGVKAVRTEGGMTILAHETTPQLYNLKWIAPDSPVPYGPGARYRNVRISLPYLVTLIVFRHGGNGQPFYLTDQSECFFRVGPLQSVDDPLLYPALLNCSKFRSPEGRPLAWICTQHLDFNAVNREASAGGRLRAGFSALMHCLLETGFNYSSERHEGSSWFTESCRIDSRVSSIDQWQQATLHDPLFVLEIPWLQTGLSLTEVMSRTFKNCGAGSHGAHNAGSLARLVFNQKPSNTPAAIQSL